MPAAPLGCALWGAKYVEPQRQRFVVDRVDGVEQLRIPNRRNWFAIVFLSFWLVMWTFGGIAAMLEVARTGEPFLYVWLCGWAAGWIFAALTIGTQLAGAEIIRVQGQDLETSNGFGFLRSTRRYRGSDIRDLSSSNPSAFGMPFRMPSLPFVKPFAGAVKFHYGASTVYLASSSEEAEGQMIVAWLKPRLPGAASE
jgi:hypothetical protein